MTSPVVGGNRVIVVGGGLAGLCAAHSVLEHGGSVLLVDKSAFLGGNSTKASSGITGTPTQAQIDAGVLDGVAQFIQDTNRSFHGISNSGNDKNKNESNNNNNKIDKEVSPLVEELARLSAPSLEWLTRRFHIDLSQLGLMGGHSKPRVHRGSERFPGMAITCALIDALEEQQKKNPQQVQIVTKVKVIRLIREPIDDVSAPITGVVLENRKGEKRVERGVVIITTGGYAADFGSSDMDKNNSLLARFTPNLLKFSTTNAEHATGDGIKVAEQVGAMLTDMEYVQVHPTGLVDPKDSDNHVKFLCAEALRGTGALILNGKGKRFVNELGRRDEVSHAMLQNNLTPFRLVLTEACAKEMPWHCKHYTGRGLMKHYKSGVELAEEMKIKPSELQREFDAYRKVAKAHERLQRRLRRLKGKTSSSSSSSTDMEKEGNKIPGSYGKTIYRNADSFRINAPLYVALITPVVHYTMGGLAVNVRTEVLDSRTKQPIPGLFCAGEAAGGIHGKNRLGGNSLLDCVVFGRVAGEEATRYLLSTFLGPTSNYRLNTIYSHLTLDQLSPLKPLPTGVSSPESSEDVTASNVKQESNNNSNNNNSSSEGGKKFTRAEVAKHNKPNDCWCIIAGQVLDLTAFLPDHPGGKQSILLYAGKDATTEFDLVHKRDIIEKYTPEAVLGTVID
ncbi:flavoprotein subunit-like protein [Trypanosoma theileri]|uniref:Flavoprotein subunit-like protein n=1 Tax=Trypanosoma theileri TaxID=67003 RepID=A0A1X0NPF8_9TRYP|nr:flavoprotein subunit-like protein [Trypanosoma theileri]ORC86592.1 flavoprotein subunit-like protein [Trypanosoma theileri]